MKIKLEVTQKQFPNLYPILKEFPLGVRITGGVIVEISKTILENNKNLANIDEKISSQLYEKKRDLDILVPNSFFIRESYESHPNIHMLDTQKIQILIDLKKRYKLDLLSINTDFQTAVNQFDFDVSQVYLNPETMEITLSSRAINALIQKTFSILNTKAKTSQTRIEKYRALDLNFKK